MCVCIFLKLYSLLEICALYEIILHNLQVNAFRSMMHDDMMVGAFSHSTAIGKLRKDLPDVPVDARVNLPRYSLDEAATVCHYYLRYANEMYMLVRVCNVEQC
jgi:hypothetical protein